MRCDRMLCDFLDIAGQSESVDMTIGDQRQQRQVWRHAGGVTRTRNTSHGCSGEREVLRANGPAPQAAGAEIPSDRWAHRGARQPPVRRDTGAKASDHPNRLWITARFRCPDGDRGAQCADFGNRSSGFHDRTIG
jgi:hypothetical protein